MFKKKTIYFKAVAALLCLGMLTGYYVTSGESAKDSYRKADKKDSLVVKDKESLYSFMPLTQVLYLTVGRGMAEGDHTWQEINSHDLSWYESNDTDIYECKALVQFGSEEGPTSGSFGFDMMSNNATVRLSGKRASERQQKNYRIKIDQGSGNVYGMKNFILNKSFSDPFRFTNKLSFDLIAGTDGFMSVRTGFVHLYVRDESEGSDALFVDYGLYTMTETINNRYLTNRSLDSSGELYGAEEFDFDRHPDVIMQPTDSSYDREKFEKLLKAKGSDDYTKLINMLDALADDSLSIEEVVERYFDKDSLYNYMAFNILLDNKDTDTENFYLYSPTGTEKFYVIPWDMDGALRSDYEHLRDPSYSDGWERGIYLYTDSKLFGRIIRSKPCLNELSERISLLHETSLSGENVVRRARDLALTIKPYLYTLPDMTFARVSKSDHDALVEMLKTQMDRNFYAYYDTMDTPWPFHIREPEREGTGVKLTWDESFLPERDVTYDIDLSDSWDFTHTIISEKGLKTTRYDAGDLKPGQYFLRVRAVSPDGVAQEAYEFYNTELKTRVHGVMCFYVFEDGTVKQSVYEE